MPASGRGERERQVLQTLKDQGGESDTTTLKAILKMPAADLMRILKRCEKQKLLTRTDHPDRDLPKRPKYLFTLTDEGRAQLDPLEEEEPF